MTRCMLSRPSWPNALLGALLGAFLLLLLYHVSCIPWYRYPLRKSRCRYYLPRLRSLRCVSAWPWQRMKCRFVTWQGWDIPRRRWEIPRRPRNCREITIKNYCPTNFLHFLHYCPTFSIFCITVPLTFFIFCITVPLTFSMFCITVPLSPFSALLSP